jgi:hypothetical protein
MLVPVRGVGHHVPAEVHADGAREQVRPLRGAVGQRYADTLPLRPSVDSFEPCADAGAPRVPVELAVAAYEDAKGLS